VAPSSLALEGGPPSFPQDFACPVVLRYPTSRVVTVAYRTLTVSGGASQHLRLTSLPATAISRSVGPYNPAAGALIRPRRRFGQVQAGSFATTTALSYLIPLPRGTEMFQFPRCPSPRLCIQRGMRAVARTRVAPFGFAWLIARLQLPRHVSPLSASFLGSWPLGIPPVPLLAWRAFHQRPASTAPRSYLLAPAKLK
jgi:hypothetical protein